MSNGETTTTRTTTRKTEQPAPTESPARKAARTWSPHREWLHPTLAALWAYVVAVAAEIAAVPAWWATPAVLVGALAGWARARHLYPDHRYGMEYAGQLGGIGLLAALATAGWWAALGWTGASVLEAWALAAWAITALVVAGLYAAVYRHQYAARDAVRDQIESANRREFTDAWNRVLARSGLPQCRVTMRTDDETPDGGAPTGYTLTVNGAKALDDGKGGRRPVATAKRAGQVLDAVVATASSELSRAPFSHRIEPGSLTVRATDVAHVFLLHVLTHPPLRAKLVYQLVDAPRRVAEGVQLGRTTLNARWRIMVLRAHMKIVGATQAGKSTMLRRLIAALLECADVTVWLAATEKLMPLAASWVLPYLQGKTDRPAIDWVAGEAHARVLECLEAARHLMKLRNSALGFFSHVKVSDGQPFVVVLLDESQACLTRPETIRTFDGHDMTASELVLEIVRAGASAGVAVETAGQSGLLPAYGKHGPDIARNQAIRLCGATLSHHDGQATLPALAGKVDTTRLRDNLWLYQGKAEEPTVDRVKAELIDDEDVPAIAETYTPWRPASVDAVHGHKLGEAYERRWDADRNLELAAACVGQGWAWPGGGDAAGIAPAAPQDVPGGAPGAPGGTGGGGAAGMRSTPVDGDVTLGTTERARWEALVAGIFPAQAGGTADTGGGTGGGEQPGTAPGGHGAVESPADPFTAMQDALTRAKQAYADRPVDGQAPETFEGAPEPLRTIVRKLTHPQAPTAWVSTSTLALQLGRVDDSSDDEEVTAAAVRLGQELARQHPDLRSSRPRTGEGRSRGYAVPDLFATARVFGDRTGPDQGPVQ